MNGKSYRLNDLQSVRRYLAKVINDYRNGILLDDNGKKMTDVKFKTLVYSLNSLHKMLEKNTLQNKIEEVETNTKNQINDILQFIGRT